MTVLDDKIVPKVEEILDKYGKDLTVRDPGSDSYDPDTGLTTPGTPTDHVIKASPPWPYDYKLVDGQVIRPSDSWILMAKSGLPFTEPKVGWEIFVDSEEWTVVDTDTIWSGEQIAAYTCQLRK